jgi:hypothetical protein
MVVSCISEVSIHLMTFGELGTTRHPDGMCADTKNGEKVWYPHARLVR